MAVFCRNGTCHIELLDGIGCIFKDFSRPPNCTLQQRRMDPLMIAASGGMRSRMESLDMLANNVANSGVAGFKADREFYNLYTSEQADSSDGTSSLPVIERPWTDFAQGTLVSTNSPSDLAITGKGFFVIDSPSGPLYTR